MIALIATYWYIAIPAFAVSVCLFGRFLKAIEAERDRNYNNIIKKRVR